MLLAKQTQVTPQRHATKASSSPASVGPACLALHWGEGLRHRAVFWSNVYGGEVCRRRAEEKEM